MRKGDFSASMNLRLPHPQEKVPKESKFFFKGTVLNKIILMADDVMFMQIG